MRAHYMQIAFTWRFNYIYTTFASHLHSTCTCQFTLTLAFTCASTFAFSYIFVSQVACMKLQLVMSSRRAFFRIIINQINVWLYLEFLKALPATSETVIGWEKLLK